MTLAIDSKSSDVQDIYKRWDPEVPSPWPVTPAVSLIDPESRIMTIGSCFAANIREYLAGTFPYLLLPSYPVTLGCRQYPDAGYLPPWDATYDTYSIRREVEHALFPVEKDDRWIWNVGDWAVRYGYPDPAFMDPYRRWVVAEDPEEVARVREEIDRTFRDCLFEASVITLTLGLIEVWFDDRTGEAICRYPPGGPPRGVRERLRFHVASYEENLENLRAACRLISEHTDASVILTVSPVPLRKTFRDLDVRVANNESKAVLRAVAGAVVREFDGVHYFPSYEIATSPEFQTGCFKEDRRHVAPEGIRIIGREFFNAFAPGLLEAGGPSRPAGRRKGKPRASPAPSANGHCPPVKDRVVLNGIEEVSVHFPERARVLAVGSPDGCEAEALRDLGFEDVTAVNIGPEWSGWVGTRPVAPVSMDPHRLEFPDGSFDVVFSWHTLEHCPDPEGAAAELVRVLRPGGTLCVIVDRQKAMGEPRGVLFQSPEDLTHALSACGRVIPLRCEERDVLRLTEQRSSLWFLGRLPAEGEDPPRPGSAPRFRDPLFLKFVWPRRAVPAVYLDGVPTDVPRLVELDLLRRARAAAPLRPLRLAADPASGAVRAAENLQGEWESVRVLPRGEFIPWSRSRAASADILIARGLLAASPEPFEAAEALVRLLAPGGRLMVLEPVCVPWRGAGESRSVTSGPRVTEAGLLSLFAALEPEGVEAFGPLSLPFCLTGIWRKAGAPPSRTRLPERAPLLGRPFTEPGLPRIRVDDSEEDYLTAFSADVLRRLDHRLKGRVLVAGIVEGAFDCDESGDVELLWRSIFELASGEAPLPESSFDAALFPGGLEHVFRPWEAVRAAFRLLRPAGTLALWVPCLEPLPVGPAAPLWRFTPGYLRKGLSCFRDPVVEPVGPSNAPLRLFAWAER